MRRVFGSLAAAAAVAVLGLEVLCALGLLAGAVLTARRALNTAAAEPEPEPAQAAARI